jgi:hypothetical protein
MKKCNILYLQKHFDLSGEKFGPMVGKYLTNEIKKCSENFYDINYFSLYFEKGKKGFEDYIVNFVIERKIDYVFFSPLFHDVTVDPLFLKRLHGHSTLVLIIGDCEYYFEKIHRYYAQLFDLVLFFGNYSSKAGFELLDINVLHFKGYYDTAFFRSLGPCEKNLGVSFVGSIGQANRRQYIEYLEENGVAVEQYGPGTRGGILHYDEMINTYQRSKINLHFTTLSYFGGNIIYPSKINQRIRQFKGRLVEVPLTGGFLLTEYMPDIEGFFKVGEECDVFYSEKDMLEKVKYYLEHDEERESIAKRGHERALRDYDVRAGVKEVFFALKNNRKSKITSYLDDDFLELYSNKRFYYVAYFIANAELGKLIQEIKIIFSNLRCFNIKKAFLFFLAGITETVITEKIRRPFRRFKFYSFLKKIPRY